MAISRKKTRDKTSDPKTLKPENTKIKWILLVLGLLFLVVLIRLFQLQILMGGQLESESLSLRSEDKTVPATRGTIYDSNGQEMAVDASISSLWIDANYMRSHLSDRGLTKDEAATAIAEVLQLEPAYVLRKMELFSGFVWLKKEVSFDEVSGIEDLGIIGIYPQEEGSRYYPDHTIGGNLLGFVNKTGVGVAGIESTYDDILQGTDGYYTGEKDGKGNLIPDTIKVVKDPIPGNSIVLTINQKAQYIAERVIGSIQRDLDPDSAVIMVMEVKTGAILASANTNTYDPNNYQDQNSSLFTTLEYQGVYEPGSVMKVITSAAAINEKVVTEESLFYDNGFRKIGTHTIKCWVYPNSHGEETFTDGVADSCNPVFVDTAMAMKAKDPTAWYRYLDAFGFGRLSALNFTGESSGIKPAGTGDIYHATSAIGQGIAVTPIQMLVGATAAVNGGQMMKPYLVKEVLATDGTVLKTYEPTIEGQVISKESSEAVRRMLIQVVERGTGVSFQLKSGITSMGKTGTAQKVESTGEYQAGKYVLSYIGFAPANDPTYAVLVVVDESKKLGWVSSTTAPYYKAVMEDILALYGVTNSANPAKTTDTVLVPDLNGMRLEDGGIVLDALGLKLVATGTGYIIKQVPRPGYVSQKGSEVKVTANEKALTETQTVVPTFSGLRLPQAISRAEGAALTITYKGFGFVRNQSVPAGTIVDKNSVVEIELGD